jgi:hypothetical protein
MESSQTNGKEIWIEYGNWHWQHLCSNHYMEHGEICGGFCSSQQMQITTLACKTIFS